MVPEKLKEFSKESMRDLAREIVLRKLFLLGHFIAYFFVNVLLLGINLSVDYTYPWHIWPLACWGVAVAAHAFNYIIYRKGVVATLGGAFFVYHVFFYLVVSCLLLFINWFTLGVISWFWWPFGAWSGLLLLHLGMYIATRPKAGENPKKSWIDRKIERELAKIREA